MDISRNNQISKGSGELLFQENRTVNQTVGLEKTQDMCLKIATGLLYRKGLVRVSVNITVTHFNSK